MSEQKLTVFIALGIFELVLLIVLLLVVRDDKRRSAAPYVDTIDELLKDLRANPERYLHD